MSLKDTCSTIFEALRLSIQLEKHGVATTEGLERYEAAHHLMNRRQFLKASAVTAGVAMLPDLRFATRLQGQTPRVVVVGGGLAGLTAAFRLFQAGISAQVLKPRTRLGGRLYTARNLFPDGQVAELGAEFIGSEEQDTLNLITEMNLNLIDLHAANGTNTTDTYFFEGRALGFGEIVDGFRPMASRMVADLSSLNGDMNYMRPDNGKDLDQLSVAGWMDSRGVTGVMAKIVNAALVGLFGREGDDQNGYNLLTSIPSSDSRQFQPVNEQMRRYRIAEGADSLVARLADQLTDQLLFGSVLEAIGQRSDDVYVLTVQENGTSRDIEADKVVLALPFSTLRNIDIRVDLPPAKLQAIQSLGYGAQSILVAGFSEKVWQTAGSNGNIYADLGFQRVNDDSRGLGGSNGILRNTVGGNNSITASSMASDTHTSQFVGQIDHIFPGAAAAFTGQSVSVNWADDPYALGNRACYLPGQITAFRGAESEAVGGIHFCGEHTSLNAQGRIQGAVESGNRAAAEILASL